MGRWDAEATYWRHMFLKLARSKLSPLQKLILIEARRLEGSGLTLTGLAKAISARHGIPLSTVKWNLRKLRELDFITGGNKKVRGPYVLTIAGRELADALFKYHLRTTGEGMANKK